MSAERHWRHRVEHLLEAVQRIRRYTADLDQASFAKDERTIDAVVRNFQVMGDAARQVPADVQARYPDVPWREIMAMRHVLVHDYFRVKSDVIWNTIQAELPALIEPFQRILSDHP